VKYIYIEDNIFCYDSYITLLNTKSFAKMSKYNLDFSRILVGSDENDIFLSFLTKENWASETQIDIDKKGYASLYETSYTSEYGRFGKERVKSILGKVKKMTIIKMKDDEKEIKKKTQTKEIQPLDSYGMLIVSKYFKWTNDYIKLEKTNKKYRGIIEQFKYNPIPFKNEKEREVFKNMELYNFYDRDFEKEKEMIKNDKRIKKYVYWDVSYSYWKENKKENEEYKKIGYEAEDMAKYLLTNDIGPKGDMDGNISEEDYYAIYQFLLKKQTINIKENIFVKF